MNKDKKSIRLTQFKFWSEWISFNFWSTWKACIYKLIKILLTHLITTP